MRSKFGLAIPLLISIVLAASGLWILQANQSLSSAPVAKEFQTLPLATSLPPPGAVPHDWRANLYHEIVRDGTLLILASIVLVATLLRLAQPGAQRRVRSSVLLFFVYLATLPIGAILLAGVRLEPYGYVRAAALFCSTLTVSNLVAILLFDVFIAAIGVKIPPILRELVTGIVFIIALLSVLSRAGVQLSGILTTSAILTAVIGLSIQSTLGDVVSGVALEWEDSIEVGDWVKIGDTTGLVKEIRWRHRTLETRNWETVLIPNSLVMKTPVSILGRRTGKPLQHRRWVYFLVEFKHTPTSVIGAVEEALLAAPIERVATEPKANCILLDFKEFAAQYAVRYWLTDIAVDDPTDSLVRTRIHFALRRAGIDLALPARQINTVTRDESERARELAEQTNERLRALRTFAIFGMLTEAELASLCPHLRHAPFAQGEIMTREGAEAHWLYLICRGQAIIKVGLPSGEQRFVAKLGQGDFFGERALLTGERRAATVIAETECECWRLDRDGFKDVVQKRPEIAQELSRILAARQVANNEARLGGSASQDVRGAEHDLLTSIRDFFGLAR